MTAHISRALLDQIIAHAASDPDREVCGLLLGPPANSFPFALGVSKGCSFPSSVSPQTKGRAGLRQAQPEREGDPGIETEIMGAVPTANLAADPARRFEVDPAALFAAIRAERGGGAQLLGHYHSHPSGCAIPSPRDAAMADRPGRVWLIVAAGEVLGWRESPGGSVQAAFEPCPLRVEDGCA
jgi:desampylase